MKRNGQTDTDVLDSTDSLPAAALLAATAGGKGVGRKGASDDEKMHIFWRVFGGTILSIVALVVITVYNNMISSLNDLRAEVNRLHEARAELIKKDEFNTRLSNNYERIQGLQAQNNTQNATLTSLRTEIDGLKERLGRQAAELDAARKDTQTAVDGVRKDVTGIELLKDRVTAVEGLRKDMMAVDGLKERVATLLVDVKAVRDEAAKLRQDVDRNQTADQERKLRRDEQYRDLEKLVREFQAAVQDCQVKLARLEGLQATPAAAKPTVKPVSRTVPPKAADPEPKGGESAPPPRSKD
jgi:chromosome segregation ATPase